MNDATLQERMGRLEMIVAGPTARSEVVAGVVAAHPPHAESTSSEPAAEVRFTVAEMWAQKVLVALLVRRGFAPYRKRGQHATTLMVKAPPTFVQQTIMAEYAAITGELERWIDTVTAQVIAEVIGGGGDVVRPRE